MMKADKSRQRLPSSHPAAAGNKERSDWRSETLSRIRSLIKQADPEVVEEIKWRKPSAPDGVPTWSHDGLICTGETYKSAVLAPPTWRYPVGDGANRRRGLEPVVMRDR